MTPDDLPECRGIYYKLYKLLA